MKNDEFSKLASDKRTFTAEHPDIGECIVDRLSLLARQARDDRWTSDDQPEGDARHLRQAGIMVGFDIAIPVAPVAADDDETDDDEPDDDEPDDNDEPDDRLRAAVNDRALPALAEQGITTYEDFVAAARLAQETDELQEFTDSIPYLRIARVERMLAEEA